MEWIVDFIGLFQHVDIYIMNLLKHHGIWTYLILFIIVFSETGFIVTSFLPGDPLLLVVGTLCATGSLDIKIAIPLLTIAAITGNSLNYWIGYKLGPKVFSHENSKIFKRENLLRAHRFYEKYGGATIIASRFLAIIRAFAPFIAGIANMHFGKFTIYNIIGGIGWVTIFTLIGFFFGKLHIVQDNASLMMILMLIISFTLIPFFIGFAKNTFKKHSRNEN